MSTQKCKILSVRYKTFGQNQQTWGVKPFYKVQKNELKINWKVLDSKDWHQHRRQNTPRSDLRVLDFKDNCSKLE